MQKRIGQRSIVIVIYRGCGESFQMAVGMIANGMALGSDLGHYVRIPFCISPEAEEGGFDITCTELGKHPRGNGSRWAVVKR
jgi:hypothetical protein